MPEATPRTVALRERLACGARNCPCRKATGMTHCPAHDDRRPSLSLVERDGTLLWKCHAGCAQAEVAAALPDGGRDPHTIGREDIEATYPYHDEDGMLLYEVVRGHGKRFWQQQPTRAGGRVTNLQGVRRVLYHLAALIAAVQSATPVWIVEGEKDVHAVEAHGGVATCNPGGAGQWRDAYAAHFNGATVTIVADRDGPGRAHARAIHDSLIDHAASIRLVEAAEGKDASDHLAAGYDLTAFVDLPDPVAQPPRGLRRLSDFTSVETSWCWPGYIPLGQVTLLDGDPGRGKSTLSLDLAARVTTGRPMPDGSPGIDGGVLVLTYEDGYGETVRPRVEAAGGDPDRIGVYDPRADPTDAGWPMLDNIDWLRDAIGTVTAKLVIIDPLMASLPGSTDSHRDQDVRRVLTPLATLAGETGVAVLVIRHLNKSLNSRAIYRGGGSIAFAGAARSVLLAGAAPGGSPGDFVLAVAKANLAAPAPALAYRIAPTDDAANVPSSRIAWGGPVPMSADDLVAPPAEPSARHQAVAFLREVLAAGPQPAADVRDEARAAGISDMTLKRAKTEAGVTSQKDGMSGSWFWALPEEDHAVPKGVKEVTPQK